MLGDPRRELSLLLQQAMERDGLKTAAELARRIGIPGQRVRSYLRADCRIETDIDPVAKYLGLSISELLDRLGTVRSHDIVPYLPKMPESELSRLKQALDKLAEQEMEVA